MGPRRRSGPATRQVDLVTITGNVAQVFLTDEDWISTLSAIHSTLRPGGRLVFEVRDPAKEAWQEWDRARTYKRQVLPGSGAVEMWVGLTRVDLPMVSFRQTFVFEIDGAVITSDSTLRFRTRAEIEASLRVTSYMVEEVRDAPDRPGFEFVFIAHRSAAERPGSHG